MNHRIERERLIFCRAEEQSAPEGRASAAPRSGGRDAVTVFAFPPPVAAPACQRNPATIIILRGEATRRRLGP